MGNAVNDLVRKFLLDEISLTEAAIRETRERELEKKQYRVQYLNNIVKPAEENIRAMAESSHIFSSLISNFDRIMVAEKVSQKFNGRSPTYEVSFYLRIGKDKIYVVASSSHTYYPGSDTPHLLDIPEEARQKTEVVLRELSTPQGTIEVFRRSLGRLELSRRKKILNAVQEANRGGSAKMEEV